jgi:N-methylhydantoinase B/oxoprolinase/acetone carboxylase alpha subunit
LHRDSRVADPNLLPRVRSLEGCDQTVVKAGEAVIVTTPTGGGFGEA